MSLNSTVRLPAWCADADERLRFLLVLAVAFHALLLILLGFDYPDTQRNSHTLEITIAQRDDKQSTADAEFLAQANQLGGGNAARDIEAFAPQRAQFDADTPATLSAKRGQGSGTALTLAPESGDQQQSKKAKAADRAVITADKSSLKATAENHTTEKLAAESLSGDSTALENRTKEIASLEARIRDEQQKLEAKSRVARVTSISTLAQADALYLDRWRQRIEAIGNLQYPREARAKGIQGSLRLLVSIRSDGTVERLEMLESSGYAVLDNAAVRVVQTATPFEPFPAEMRKRIDRLEVIRTWKFEKETKIY